MYENIAREIITKCILINTSVMTKKLKYKMVWVISFEVGLSFPLIVYLIIY